MEIDGKALVGAAVVLIVGGAGLYLFVPAYQRAKAIANLPTKRVDITMRNESGLERSYYVSPEVGCRMRLPANLPTPVPNAMSQGAIASFGLAQIRDTVMFVKLVDNKGRPFAAHVVDSRNALQTAEKQTVDDEGMGEVNGYRTWVCTTHATLEGTPFRGRFYLIDGPNAKLYVIAVLVREDKWATMEPIFDSAVSTFEIGNNFPAEPPIARAPAAPIPATPNPAMPAPMTPPPSPGPADPQASGQPPFAQRPPTSAIPERAQRPQRAIEVLVNGKWELAFVLEEKEDQVQVRYARFREAAGERTAWVKKDQTRAWAPQRGASTRPAPTEATPAVAQGNETYRVGQRIEAFWGSKWWPGKIVALEAGRASVDYDDWSADEWVTMENLRPVGSTKVSPNERRFGGARAANLSVDEAAALLIQRSPFDKARGAEALAGMTPDKGRQPAIIQALAGVLKEDSIHTRSPAARALGVWADDATERAFIGRLVSGKKEERPAIFEMLGARKTVTAARALARRLRVPEDAMAVEAELKKMGTVAEPAVRETLADADKGVRRRSADILSVIGTKESLPALKKAGTDTDASVNLAAKLAIQRIEEQR